MSNNLDTKHGKLSAELEFDYKTDDEIWFWKVAKSKQVEDVPEYWYLSVDAVNGHVFCDCPNFEKVRSPLSHKKGIIPTISNKKTCCKHLLAAVKLLRQTGVIPTTDDTS